MEKLVDVETQLDIATLRHFEGQDALKIPDQFSSPCCYGRGKLLKDIVLPRLPKLSQEENTTVDVGLTGEKWRKVLQENGLVNNHRQMGRGKLDQSQHTVLSIEGSKFKTEIIARHQKRTDLALSSNRSYAAGHTRQSNSGTKHFLFDDMDFPLFENFNQKEALVNIESHEEFPSLSGVEVNKNNNHRCIREQKRNKRGNEKHTDEGNMQPAVSDNISELDGLAKESIDVIQAKDSFQTQAKDSFQTQAKDSFQIRNNVFPNADMTYVSGSKILLSEQSDGTVECKPLKDSLKVNSSKINSHSNFYSIGNSVGLLESIDYDNAASQFCVDKSKADGSSNVPLMEAEKLNKSTNLKDQGCNTGDNIVDKRKEALNKDDYSTESKSASKSACKVKKNLQSGWKLYGPMVVHIENVPKKHGNDLLQQVKYFGKVLDSEKKARKGAFAWRFQLETVDICNYVVDCLHGAPLFEGYSTVLECYRMEEKDDDGTAV